MMRSPVYAFTALMLAGVVHADPARDEGQEPSPGGSLPRLIVPDGLGVNIHFLQPRPGEMEMLAQAGFRWIRMRFQWNRTEPKPGRYDFAAYDRFLSEAEPHGIRMLWILDYWNPNYDEGLFPLSEEARAAFARWAAAAAAHFRGRGVLWEMLNEPNGPQWKPRLNVARYARLAVETGRALRAAAPREAFVGPATSQFAFPFQEECFRAGVLEYWSAVSVHPYRHAEPETVADDYARLRQLIGQYAPSDKQVPILSGEWGYSSAWKDMDEAKQAKLLPRQYLINLANGVPISIWYDWHDDGTNPSEPEHHFGTVQYPYFADRRPVYDPKPAYLAAQTLTRQLSGFVFKERLRTGNAEDYVLAFTKDDQTRLAAWTTSAEPHAVLIPGFSGHYQVTGHTGQPLPVVNAGDGGLSLTLTDGPQYLRAPFAGPSSRGIRRLARRAAVGTY